MQRLALNLLLAAGALAQSANYPYVLKQFAGNNNLGDGGFATSALLVSPTVAATDPLGNLLIFDSGWFRQMTPNGVINTVAMPVKIATDFKYTPDGTLYVATGIQLFKISPAGQSTLIAGSLAPPYTSDGAPAVTAQLSDIFGVAVDSVGNVYFSENGSRVREVTTDGLLHTFAGGPLRGYGGDNGQATAAALDFPLNLSFDSSGNLYILDRSNFRIRMVTPQGTISTFAGNASGGKPVNGPATSSPLGLGALFGGLAIDAKNNVFVGDEANGVLDEITPKGMLTQIAGMPQTRFGYYADGAAGEVSFNNIQAVAIDPNGYPIVVDAGGRIVEILPNGNAHTLAGMLHFAGDGGRATSALLNAPYAVASDTLGNVFIADGNNLRIRKVTPDGKINTVAGSGLAAVPSTTGSPAQSPLQNVGAIAADSKGNVFFESDPGAPGPGQVFELGASGPLQAVAGQPGFGQDSGIGGPATQALVGLIYGLALDPTGNVYLADFYNQIYEVAAASGKISAFAGAPQGGILNGIGGPATSVPLNLRASSILASDNLGNVYISDYGCECILSVSPSGIVTLAAGNGSGGQIVDGQPASAPLSFMGAIAVDSGGSIYANAGATILRISGSVVHIIAGQGSMPAADGLFATAAQFPTTIVGWEYIGGIGLPEFGVFSLSGLAVDGNGDVYVAETGRDIVWKLMLDSPTGLTMTGGNNQTGQVGWTLPNALKVAVNGRAGVPVPGVTVNFAVTSGSATLGATSVVSDSSGAATVPLILGANPGSVVVTATIAGFPPVQFNATTVGAPAGGGVICTVSAAPAIVSVNSATDFGGFSTFAPGSWLEVKGSNLAVDTRLWAGSDFQGANAPTRLDSSTVSIDGNASFVDYISGGQINVQAPADTSTGAVNLTVTTCAGTSLPFTVQQAAIVPGMLAPTSFNIGGKQYLVALFQDGSTYVGNSGLIPGVPFRPAAPGDTITAYGIGFGAVTPSVPPGEIVGQSNSIPNLSFSFGQTPAAVTYAGLAPDAVGLYQFNITVPQLAAGDYQINIGAGGVQVPQILYLTVGQ